MKALTEYQEQEIEAAIKALLTRCAQLRVAVRVDVAYNTDPDIMRQIEYQGRPNATLRPDALVSARHEVFMRTSNIEADPNLKLDIQEKVTLKDLDDFVEQASPIWNNIDTTNL